MIVLLHEKSGTKTNIPVPTVIQKCSTWWTKKVSNSISLVTRNMLACICNARKKCRSAVGNLPDLTNGKGSGFGWNMQVLMTLKEVNHVGFNATRPSCPD